VRSAGGRSSRLASPLPARMQIILLALSPWTGARLHRAAGSLASQTKQSARLRAAGLRRNGSPETKMTPLMRLIIRSGSPPLGRAEPGRAKLISAPDHAEPARPINQIANAARRPPPADDFIPRRPMDAQWQIGRRHRKAARRSDRSPQSCHWRRL
jgi:hypothetical protein